MAWTDANTPKAIGERLNQMGFVADPKEVRRIWKEMYGDFQQKVDWERVLAVASSNGDEGIRQAAIEAIAKRPLKVVRTSGQGWPRGSQLLFSRIPKLPLPAKRAGVEAEPYRRKAITAWHQPLFPQAFLQAQPPKAPQENTTSQTVHTERTKQSLDSPRKSAQKNCPPSRKAPCVKAASLRP